MLNQKARHSLDELTPGYDILAPDATYVPFVFNSPHSGRHYPLEFLKQSRLSPLLLRRSEDALVDHLYDFVPNLGAPLLTATFPRAFVDVNREPFELDPKVFDGPLPKTSNDQSVRVMAGLGTIARVVGVGLEIYRKPLSLEEGLSRITDYYLPYHRVLSETLTETVNRFETAILIDCHSMPSGIKNSQSDARPDFVIGDRFGSSAQPELVGLLIKLLQDEGYRVDYNKPYAGGYITEHYGNPSSGVHAIQVEINRSLYLDEMRLEPNTGFENLRANLRRVFSAYVDEVTSSLMATRSAAE